MVWVRAALVALTVLASTSLLGYAPAAQAQTCTTPFDPVRNGALVNNGTTMSEWTTSGVNLNTGIPPVDYSTDGATGILRQQVYGVSPGSLIMVNLAWGNGLDGADFDGNQAKLTLSYGGVIYAEFLTSAYQGAAVNPNPGPTTGATYTGLAGATITGAGWGTTTNPQVYTIALPAGIPMNGEVLITMTQNQTGTGTTSVDDIRIRSVHMDTAAVCLEKTSVGGTGAFSFSGTNLDTDIITPLTQTTTTITTAVAGSPTAPDSAATIYAGIQPLVRTTAGGTFSLTETALATDFDLTSMACTAGTPVVSGSTLTITGLAALQDVTCTFTNTKKAKLTLVKKVTNDNGGTAVVGAFGITSSAGALVFGANTGTATNAVYTTNTLTVVPGAYTLRENDIAGYTEGTWTCTTGGTVTNATISAGSVTLAPGAVVTCEITNNDQPAALTLIKRVTNDNGGTSTVTAFGVTTSAGALTFGAATGTAPTLSYTSNTFSSLNPGVYTLRENDIAGYAEGAWSCSGTGGTLTNNTITAGSVTLAGGAAVTCEITNNDQQSSITIIKDAVPNDAQDFAFTTSGTGLSSFGLDDDADPALSNARTFNGLAAGSYTVTETAMPAGSGWTLTNLVCDDPDNGSTVNVGTGLATVDLDPGENITCTYTNTRRLANLSITKTNATPFNPLAPNDAAGDTVTRGTTTAYTIVVTNSGPDAITGATVRDPATSGLVCADPVTCTGSACPAATVPLSNLQGTGGVVLGTLPNGGTVTFTMSCTVQ